MVYTVHYCAVRCSSTCAVPCAQLEQQQLSSFATHQVYADKLIELLATAAARELNVTVDEVMEKCGEYFITFVGRYGYDSVLKVLGRHLRDFLNGLDNLHAYLRSVLCSTSLLLYERVRTYSMTRRDAHP